MNYNVKAIRVKDHTLKYSDIMTRDEKCIMSWLSDVDIKTLERLISSSCYIIIILVIIFENIMSWSRAWKKKQNNGTKTEM